MVPLQTRVVSQNLARGQPVRRAAQSAGLARQHHRSEPDAVVPQFAPQLGPVTFGRHKVSPIGHQGAHFIRHAAAQLAITTEKRHHHGFGILAEQAENPALKPLLHSTDLVLHRTAEAASGMTAAMAVTGW